MIYMSVLHNKGNVWGFIARCEQHDEFVLIKPEGQLISLLILSSLRGFVSEKYILPAPIKSQWSYCMWNHNVSTLNKACQNSWRKTKSGWNTDKKKGQINVLKQDAWIPVKHCGPFSDSVNGRVTAEVRNKNKPCAITFIHPRTDYLF